MVTEAQLWPPGPGLCISDLNSVSFVHYYTTVKERRVLQWTVLMGL